MHRSLAPLSILALSSALLGNAGGAAQTGAAVAPEQASASIDPKEPEEEAPQSAPEVRTPLQQLSFAITEMDIPRARQLLAEEQGHDDAFAVERARLSLYVGDCDAAQAILTTIPISQATQHMLQLSEQCARAVAGAFVVEDAEAGVWIRLQEEADRALIPYIISVATSMRKKLHEDLGILLPLPLRIDVVRDLFSLAALTGLPLEAAETTGTVAVARWGRVTMLSPRAPAQGYTWQDTLAHEMTHLALSRGTRDYAPLWLQEGIAKREETRWRAESQFDDPDAADRTALDAMLSGRSVGINKIGPSIAMLPSAEDAAISYAEVTSFIAHFIETRGTAALHLLLADLKGIGSKNPEAALRSTTGFGLEYWIAHWEQALLKNGRALADASKEKAPLVIKEDHRHTARNLRLGDLLYGRKDFESSAGYFQEAAQSAPLRFRLARSLLGLEQALKAQTALGTWSDVQHANGGWLALHGRFLMDQKKVAEAEAAFAQAIQVNPLLEDVACEGRNRLTTAADSALPTDPARRKLCEAAREIERD